MSLRVDVRRILLLICGPVGLIGAAYGLTQPAAVSWDRAQRLIGLDSAAPAVPAADPVAPPPSDAVDTLAEPSAEELYRLGLACEETAEALRKRLGDEFVVLVRPPFVLAGDAGPAALERTYREMIRPIVRALTFSYVDHLPAAPLTLVLASRDGSYRAAAVELDGRAASAYYGYYERSARRLVANLGTGEGTLAHELTHALVHDDFPDMPEWFDEGLAAVHEESEFSADGKRLIGLHNWRRGLVLQALEQDALPPLRSLLSGESFRGEGEGLNYAVVRYLGLYLQDRDVLPVFYRKFRSQRSHDPTGAAVLCQVLERTRLADVEADFHAWLGTLSAATDAARGVP